MSGNDLSLGGFATTFYGTITLALIGTAAAMYYLRRNRPESDSSPKPQIVRALYCITAPILAFAIVTTAIILLIAGPCGLQIGYVEATIMLAMGGVAIPLVAAAVALGLALQNSRTVILIESALAAITAVVLFVYNVSPHQPAPTTYDHSNRCQLAVA